MITFKDYSLIKKLSPTIRKAVLLVFMRLNSGENIQQALTSVFAGLSLSDSVRRQATDLSYTLLRTELRCSFILERLFPKVSQLPALFLMLVKIAVCSLLFQEHAPAHAIVNETVRDVRVLYGHGLDRVANGALRSLQRLGNAPFELDFYRCPSDQDSFSALSRFWSTPESISRLWLSQNGPIKAEKLMQRSFHRPPSGVRINMSKPGWEKLKQEFLLSGGSVLPGKASNGAGIFFTSGGSGNIEHARLVTLQKQGRISFQAAGSLCVLAELGLLKGESFFWEGCAGFGGKTTALLEQGSSITFVSDISMPRLCCLPRECSRLGLRQPTLFLADATKLPLVRIRGNVLLDVPCSGLGVLARRPDIRRRPLDTAFMSKLQEKILLSCVERAEHGTSIAYITCTVSDAENSSLLRRVASLKKLDIVCEWQTPYDSPIEGMYGALLRVN